MIRNQAFISTLDIPGKEKLRLRQLTPDTHTGKSGELAGADTPII